MPFERDTFAAIDSSIAWERTNITLAQVRCGIEVDIPTTWSSVPVYNAMMSTLEANYGIAGAVDIQSYRLWREALDAQPLVWVDADLSQSSTTWIITFQAKQDWNYILTQSLDLCQWKQLREITVIQDSTVDLTISDAPEERAFWKVERYQPN